MRRREMETKTIDYILAMFRKERNIWRISVMQHDCDSVKEKLAEVEEAEADFRKDVGV